ncbi:hypothetical protein PM032_07450 [Halorubrum ezzemoulense]|jgi:hypothetical protein|uniref:hypothetical protein n=2 Tax=Halorubrum ezzemoulense TaxID=337243 RepID=UPI00232DCBF5|nr:hypothetical protein [Halorubrum ezzemoulense]MDB2270856.1 hypothetical protein [Halorubrum ezzemoulense]
MRHHLRKAREIYAKEGPLQIAKSAIRYIPIELNNFLFSLRHGRGTRVMAEDWDNLLILDACRYDMFSNRIDIDGELESRISLGSTSEEFMEKNFDEKQFHDTVYVNANPFIPRLNLDDGTFHAVVNCLNDWDTELQTVRPEIVAERAREASEQYPNKRLIVHFMQPHAPFIGERGRKMIGGGWTMDHDVEKEPGVWDQLRDGRDISLNTVWEAYNENLDLVLEEVKPLLTDLDGKSVITADHGNLVGERLRPIPTRRKYGHPYGVHTEELVKVPWFIMDGSNRKEISADSPVKSNDESVSDEKLEDRLEALGYR